MKKPFAIVAILIGVTTAFAQSREIGTFQFEAKQGSHTAVVIFQTRPFEKSNHKVLIDRHNRTIIDGRQSFGTNGSIPQVEITSMRVLIDSKAIKVPASLYADCYQPNLVTAHLTVKLRGTHTVIVSMNGADGGASYEVTWRLRRRGHHSRSIYNVF